MLGLGSGIGKIYRRTGIVRSWLAGGWMFLDGKRMHQKKNKLIYLMTLIVFLKLFVLTNCLNENVTARGY